MGNVRDRLEGQLRLQRQAEQDEVVRRDAAAKVARDAQPDYIPRATVSSLVAGNAPTMSTRQHAEFRQAQEPEVLRPMTRQGGSGAFTEVHAPLSQREKAERQRSLEEIAATPESQRTAAEQYWIDQHNAEVAQQERWERKKAEEQARINAANEERKRTNQRIIAVRLELDSWRASEVERQKVWALFARPESITPEQVGTVIVTLRDTLGGPRPEWAF